MSGIFRAPMISAPCTGPAPDPLDPLQPLHARAGCVIPVTAVVDDDGLVHIEGDDVSLVRWNHRPALVRDALHRFGGMAVWKPRWHILAVPTEAFLGGARTVFNLAALDQRCDCYVARATGTDHLQVAGVPAATDGPLLRVAVRYVTGRPRQRTVESSGPEGHVT